MSWLALCWPAGAHARPSVLVLGRISDNPKAHYEQLKPLLDYVVPRMRGVGITSGRILMARDSQQMSSYLRRGRVDWVTETAGTAMALQQRGGARPLLLTERNGVNEYRTVFFVHRDSPVRGLADLQGRTLALQSTLSTSAYVVPMMTLLDHGLHPEILLSPKDQASAASVGYVFARSELNVASFVHKRLVDAGALSNLDWDDGRHVPAAFRRDFRIVHETAPFPRAVEMVRSDLPPTVQARLREVLLQAAGDPQGSQALRQFFGTSGFRPLDARAQQRLDELRAGVARVKLEAE
ncbi:phosphate/phosphite/phosphonate ABC transporter substrate-binding protein [Xanthomonas sp. AmX2]|uniref:phosphate/phosphite/phosphonate ABC transporter substrate-binding protein n=1 Tax=Xanthomonas sp. TaxID=29446 RepID=UPI00197E5239|nr:phosphate/phosphite/phosphonate ABC transporter substrate-binding protein [Xanthomonas sp.]MBN6152684.1 phosphate/phosphite/phosphonate ABC transporter substrate-binding protein [Xanthomonas sp.]